MPKEYFIYMDKHGWSMNEWNNDVLPSNTVKVQFSWTLLPGTSCNLVKYLTVSFYMCSQWTIVQILNDMDRYIWEDLQDLLKIHRPQQNPVY